MMVRPRPGGRWELRVQHRLLPKPFYASFDSEAEARDYGGRLEALLAKGIVVTDLLPADRVEDPTLGVVIGRYLAGPGIPPARADILQLLRVELGAVRLSAVTYRWAEAWVASMKRPQSSHDKMGRKNAQAIFPPHLSCDTEGSNVVGLAPGTIRKRVSALAIALEAHHRRQDTDWACPLRLLPRGYASYADGARVDVARDRRLLPEEEARIRAALAGEKRPDRERPLELPHGEALALLFDLLLDTGLRLREAYTLRVDQVDLATGTLNVRGSKPRGGAVRLRQVPIKPALRARLATALRGRVGLLLFPWWTGRPEDLDRTTSLLSRAFGRLFDYAGCPDFTEHDARHEATCRWIEMRRPDGGWMFSEIEVARIMGWRDTRMLMRYASLLGSDLAARLNP